MLDTSTEAEKNVFKPYTINNHFLIIIIITIIVNTDINTILITYNFFNTLFDSLMVRLGFFHPPHVAAGIRTHIDRVAHPLGIF